MDNTTSIKDNLYPQIVNSLNNSSTKVKYKKVLSNFFEARNKDLYDNLPCSRLSFRTDDEDKLFEALNIERKNVTDAVNKTYYGTITNFNPRAAKDEFTVTQLMVLRYFFLKGQKTDIELATIYLSFSGKFYPSLHYRSYPIIPQRHVMEYVVNNSLSNKYDLIVSGSVIGAVTSVTNTWISSYKDRLKRCDDEDVVYLIQQLHSRIGSFMKNIAEEYYKAHSEKDLYMTYDSDSYDTDNYHLADSDSLKIQRITEASMNKINTSNVDYRLCNAGADTNIKATEVKSIIESILNNSNNSSTVRELVELIVTIYFSNTSAKDKSVKDISFITYSIAAKPNAKQKEILRQKEIIESWLSENSTSYLRRKSREATKNSYHRAVLLYFVLLIHESNK